MVGAVEFLRKAKAICNEHQDVDGFKLCEICPAKLLCESNLNYVNESDLVANVMAYKLEEVARNDQSR